MFCGLFRVFLGVMCMLFGVIEQKELMELFAYNQTFIHNEHHKLDEKDDKLQKYKKYEQVINALHNRYQRSLIPSSHAIYAYDKKVKVSQENKIDFINKHIIPKLVDDLKNSKNKEHGVMIKDLKEKIKSMDFSDSLPLYEIYSQIVWDEIEKQLMKLPQLEIHRLYHDESSFEWRSIRMKPESHDDDNNDINICNTKHKITRYVDQGLNQQIYRLIHGSGCNGILTTELYDTLGITSMEVSNRLNAMSTTYDIVSIIEDSDKSKPKRLYTKPFYDEIMSQNNHNDKNNGKKKDDGNKTPRRKSPQKRNRKGFMAKFQKRLDLLEKYINDNNGVVAAIEARKYLKSQDDDYNGTTLLLESKTFTRLTNRLVKDKKIKIVKYHINNAEELRTTTHPVLLNYNLNSEDEDVIKLGQASINQCNNKKSKTIANHISKVSKHEITPKKPKQSKKPKTPKKSGESKESKKSKKIKKTKKTKKSTKSKKSKESKESKKKKKDTRKKGRKRKSSEANLDKNGNSDNISNSNTLEPPRKKQKTDVVNKRNVSDDENDECMDDKYEEEKYKKVRHSKYCSYYGYIVPTMSRIRLLHEYLLQYKKNEEMGMCDVDYHPTTGLIASPSPYESDNNYIDNPDYNNRLKYFGGLRYNRKTGMLPSPYQKKWNFDDMINHQSEFNINSSAKSKSKSKLYKNCVRNWCDTDLWFEAQNFKKTAKTKNNEKKSICKYFENISI